MKRNNKKKYTVLIMSVLLISISIGYALLSSSLNIGGTSSINNPKWDIHFESVIVNEESVTPVVPATIDSSRTKVNYSINLNTPGDYYEFMVKAVNAGTIDAVIESIDTKLNDTIISELPSYLDYSITYADGVEIVNDQLFKAGQTEMYCIRIAYKKNIDSSQLPTENQTLNLSFEIHYQQANGGHLRPGSEYLYRFSNETYNTGDTLFINDVGVYNNTEEIREATNGVFLRHHINESNVILNTDLGFIYKDEIYYLKGFNVSSAYNYRDPYYEDNKNLLLNVFGSDKCTVDSSNYSSFTRETTECIDNNLRVVAVSDNELAAFIDDGIFCTKNGSSALPENHNYCDVG